MPIIGGILFFLLIVIIIVVFAGGVITEEKKGGGSCSDDASDSSVSIKGAAGAWTQKGTKAYNTAKAIFMYLVNKEGFSGAGAAGAVANANRESGFNPKAQNPGGGVAGLFQWSGWSNKVNGDRIHSGGIIKGESDLTVSKELALVHYELNHGYSRVKSAVGKATSPVKAADSWSLLYEGVSLADPQTKPDQIHADAEKAYRMFGGSKYKAKSILGHGSKAASDASSDQSGDNSCDDDDAIGTGGPLLSQAKKLLGYFTYGAHGVSGYGSWKHPNKNGQTDCSGFVWLAMKRAGYNVGNDAFFTGTMEADAKGPHKYLKQIKAKDAKPGDVIIMNIGSGVGPNGHTAIIAGKYKGYQTKIIEMGGDNHDHVHTSNIEYSFYSLIHGGARITWARPVKKK